MRNYLEYNEDPKARKAELEALKANRHIVGAARKHVEAELRKIKKAQK